MTTNLYQLRESPKVEAYQWDGSRECPGAPGWVMTTRDDRLVISIGEDDTAPISLVGKVGSRHYVYALRMFVSNPSGPMSVLRKGDWLCRDDNGIIHGYIDQVFHLAYAKVDEGDPTAE